MQKTQSDITIIGGGLTGLCIAYFLRSYNLKITIVEARNRLGGRIETSYQKNSASIERGATWLGKKHTALVSLLAELGIDIFEQELGKTAIYDPISTSPPQIVTLPENSEPSYRIKGGSTALINQLTERLTSAQIHLNQQVSHITEGTTNLIVKCAAAEYHSSYVISTLPPNLLASTIEIHPSLSKEFHHVAQKTHTWMGESIKIGLRYESPFWRAGNLSGTIVSNTGPIPELYDHSTADDSHHALKGFMNGSYFSLSMAERLELVLTQLEKYYGKQARNYQDYEEVVWRNEPFTYCPYNQHVLPHENNGHPIYQSRHLGNRLIIAGSETAQYFPGYMEGAVRSARAVCAQLEEVVKSVS